MRAILNNPDVEVYCCPQLLVEVMNVIGREKIRKYVTPAETADLLRIMRAYSHSAELTHEAKSLVRDPKDLYLLTLSETVGADYLVSGDADLLVLQRHKSTQIVRFSEFRSLILIALSPQCYPKDKKQSVDTPASEAEAEQEQQ